MGTHDIFICFSSKDEPIARAVVEFLEAPQFPCWFSSHDAGPDENEAGAVIGGSTGRRAIVARNSDQRPAGAQHGPIAEVFVEKASADARSLDELCARLSMHVRTPAERVAFVNAAQAKLSFLRTR